MARPGVRFEPGLWPDLPEIKIERGLGRQSLQSYVSDVMSGALPTGRLQRLAVERFEADLKTWRMDWSEVDRVASFFKQFLRHSTGSYDGEEFILRPFQSFIIGNLFGFRTPDGLRRFRDAHICLGRGNGKSPLAAGMALYLAFFDGEPRASVYVCATKRDQAKLVFSEAQRYVDRSEELADAIRVYRGELASANGSTVEPLSSDKNHDGLIPHGLILDELHAWNHTHRDIWEKLRSGLHKRDQPLCIIITTSGDDTSELWIAQRSYSIEVLEGNVDGSEHFAFIAEVDQTEDVFDEDCWIQANPMLAEARSPVKPRALETIAEQARTDSLLENQFRRYHCNQLVHSTEHFLAPGEWEACDKWVEPSPGEPCYGGFDLARSDDFSAIALVIPVAGGFSVLTHTWSTKRRTKALRTDEFKRLMSAESMTVHDGDQIDFADIRAKILQFSGQYHVLKWGFDPSWARETAQILKEHEGLELEPLKQTYEVYNEPIVQFRKLVRAKQIYHGGEPVLAWQVRNLLVRINAAGLSMIDRRSEHNKIDAMAAVLMAFRLAITEQQATPGWFYETNPLESG